MHRPKRTLSADDQKAVDVLLDHGANARDPRLTRHVGAVSPRRLTAASKLLELLGNMPAIDPPGNLVARTMERIDRHIAAQMGHRTASARASAGTQVH
jgi:hypothetical protein